MERVPVSLIKPLEFRKHLNIIQKFTRVYQDNISEDISVREVRCLEAQYPDMLIEIQEGDLLAGKVQHPAILFTPQAGGNEGGFAYACNYTAISDLVNHPEASPEDKILLRELKKFWETEQSRCKTRQAYPEQLKTGLPGDNWMGESGIAFPLYRMAGTHLNYRLLADEGIPGLKAVVMDKLKNERLTSQQKSFCQSCICALDLIVKICRFYARQARELSGAASDANRKDLLRIADSLEAVIIRKPVHFFEGAQLLFLWCLVSGSHNYGRLDDALGSLYHQDMKSGYLDVKEGLRIMCGLWRLMIARNAPYDGRVIIGGQGRRKEKQADSLALLAMEATLQVRDILPQLSLRFYKGQDPRLMQKALDVIGQGCTFPMLYNDNVNIPAAASAFGIGQKEAQQVIPFGCGEYIIYHKSVGTPSSVLNLLKALEVTLHKGIDPLTGRETGIDLKHTGYSTFKGLLTAFEEQLRYYINMLALQEEIEYQVAGATAPFLLLSMLYDDCLRRGKGIFSGGAKYLGGTMEIYGFTNTVDSLVAIKKLVYDDRFISIDQLVKILDNDFIGYEDIRNKLLSQPKYGNDDDTADSMAVWLHEFVCDYTRAAKKTTGLHSYLVVNINNDANTTLGRYTSASADGRKAFTSMSNGNAPMTGMDKNGVTAMLNSLVKLSPDMHAGLVQNLKLSKDMFTRYRHQLEALLNTYFDKGGTQVMITVVARDELEKAMVTPEDYQNLIVRIGGFSARFVELSREVQLEILNRTLY